MADEEWHPEYDVTEEVASQEAAAGKVIYLNSNEKSPVPATEYMTYLLVLKRLKFGEPIPESTFTDVQNPVLRRRLVRAICLRKATQKSPDTKDGPVTPTT